VVDSFLPRLTRSQFSDIRPYGPRRGEQLGRQAVRRRDYVGNRGESGSARLALETTLMQALVSGRLQSFLDTSDKVVLSEWLV
jgi:hypothetical protein